MEYRNEIWGIDGPAEWQSLLPKSELTGLDARGDWRRAGDSLRCEAGEQAAHVFFGTHQWRDYELKVLVTPEAGGNVQIPFRLSADDTQGYMLDLLGWQAVGISRLEPAVRNLSVVNHPLELGREYQVEIAARGASLTSYVDGTLVNQVTDFAHEQGRFALSVWNARTRFACLKARRIN